MPSKKVTVVGHDEQTYEVHLEMEGDPPRKATGGASLNLEHLTTELQQHGCSADHIAQLLRELENKRSASVDL